MERVGELHAPVPTKAMLFLRNKKQNKWIQTIWTVVGLMVIISMVLLYLPAFL